MNKYEKALKLNDEEYRRLCGYWKKTMKKKLEILRSAKAAKHKRRGKHSKLEVADMLMLACKYWREYETFFSLGNEYEVNLAYTRLYGWSPSGERVREGVAADVRFERQSVLSIMRVSGEIVPIVFEGTLNKEIFCAYIEQQLAPKLAAGDIVLLDNCAVHSAKAVKATLKKCGATFWYIPSYSLALSKNTRFFYV